MRYAYDKVDELNIVDKTNCGEIIPVEFNGRLRDEQEVAADELLKYNIGVLSATNGFWENCDCFLYYRSKKNQYFDFSTYTSINAAMEKIT